MTARNTLSLAAAAALAIVATAGCARKSGTLIPYPPITDPVVFQDTFGAQVDYQAFLGSKLDAVTIDTSVKHAGTASLKVTVPATGDPSGAYAGGAFTTTQARELSANTALTFWAKGSTAATLDIAGLGNDNTGTSRYTAGWSGIPLDTTWTKYIVPIPLPEKLTSEKGLFFFAEGPENGQGYTIWFDDVMFENVPGITNPRPSMTTRSVSSFVGGTLAVQGTQVIFDVQGTDETIGCEPGYFTFSSSADSVVKVAATGDLLVVGPGTASVTARLGTVDATGTVNVNALQLPPMPAPTPTVPAADVLRFAFHRVTLPRVISLFSNAYVNVPVDTWSAPWDVADVADVRIAGNDTKVYTGLGYAGIEFTSPTIDATAMTHFHIDVWVSVGAMFKVKLVDFGADGAYGGGDDREQELTFNSGTTPAMVPGTWSSLDLPLSSFTNLTTRGHLAQLILSGASTVFVDNVYFHK